MRDEFELTRHDWQGRHNVERSYMYQAFSPMRSREAYTAAELAIISKVPRTKIYAALKILVECGVVEVVEPKPIEYPEWWDYSGETSRKTWRKRNSVRFNRGKPTARWRRR